MPASVYRPQLEVQKANGLLKHCSVHWHKSIAVDLPTATVTESCVSMQTVPDL
jgi:hypothetical protein